MLRYLSCFDGKNDRLLHEKKHNKTLLLSCMIVKSYRQKNSFLFARKFINKFDFFISVMKPKIIATVKLRTFSHTLMLNCAPFKISWWLFSTSDHLHIRELWKANSQNMHKILLYQSLVNKINRNQPWNWREIMCKLYTTFSKRFLVKFWGYLHLVPFPTPSRSRELTCKYPRKKAKVMWTTKLQHLLQRGRYCCQYPPPLQREDHKLQIVIAFNNGTNNSDNFQLGQWQQWLYRLSWYSW